MLLKLVKLRLRGILSGSKRSKSGKPRKGYALLLAVVLLYCFGVFGVLFYHLFSSMAETFALLPDFAWFYFAMIALFAFGLSVMFTAFAAKSELFEARDNELLLALPIRHSVILGSRLVLLLLAVYAPSLLVLIPAALAWAAEAGTAFLPYYIPAALFLPLIGAAVACFFGWCMAQLTAHARNKTLVTMVLSVGFLVVYYYLYFNAERYIRRLLASYGAVAQRMNSWGFYFAWFGKGVAEGKPLLLLGVAALSVAVFALAVVLLSRGFLKAVSGGSAQKKAGKVVVKTGSLKQALLQRELKHFLSSAAYMLNCGLGLLFSVAAAVFLLIKQADLRALTAQMDGVMTERELYLAFALLMSFFSSMDMLTAPSISLEGKTLWILRSGPIPTHSILEAKLKFHLLLCVPPTLLLSAAAAVALRADVYGWVLLLIVPQVFVLLSGAFGLMMNLLMPKLDWPSEVVAVKQSGAAMTTMLVQMGYTALGVVGYVLLADSVLPIMTYLLLYLGLSVLWCCLCLLWLQKYGVRRFERLS